MRTDKDIGFIRKYILKLLTKFQELTIESQDSEMYYFFTKLHFRLYFKKSLSNEAVNDSAEFKKAQTRHGNMVISILHKDSKKKKYLHKKTMEAFTKDLILNQKV